MQKKTRKLLETVSGQGGLFEDDKHITTVEYTIHVHQEIIHIGNHETPGVITINGDFALIDGDWNITGKTLRLHLEDGRQWLCVIMRGNFNIFTAANAGSEGLVFVG